MKFGIIPKPKKFSVAGDKTVFTLNSNCSINCCDGVEKACDDLLAFLSKTFEIEPCGMGVGTISFEIQKDCAKSEGYKIEIDYDTVKIIAADEKGAFYAVQTLKQLLLQGNCELPKLEIFDEPEYSYRGLMLDCARYFFDKEAVMLFLDLMALHKLNAFHWHLTDDQGWRVELYNHLLLAQVGGFRPYTNFNRKPHGGFYTKQDIAEIVKYAHDRYITVIPEIDSPGHIVSAIAAYPELSCFNREMTTGTHSGIHYDVLCIGKQRTFDFMYSVFDELLEMFPDKIIHIGADEVMTHRWKSCPNCQKLMKEQGFKDEKELQTYYINKIYDHIKSKGYEVIMWNEDESENETKVSREIIREYWNCLPKNGSKEKIINAFSGAYYFDLPYGHINLKKCYENKALPDGIDRNLVVGLEACLWAEYVPDVKKAGYCLIPRLGAFAEAAWTEEKNKSYEDFTERLPQYYRLINTVPFPYATPRQAMPNIVRKLGYNLYFERRKLHWAGLQNIIENRQVAKQAKKTEK